MKRTTLEKILSLLLILTLCVSLTSGTVFSVHAEEGEAGEAGETEEEGPSEEELREKLADLEKELDELEDQIDKAKDEIAAAKARAATYAARAAIIQEQIGTLNKTISAKRGELSVKQEELDAKQREHDETYELFKQRLRAMYMNNNVSTLSLILGARTFSEFLVAAKTQASISRHDTELVDKLDKEAKVIEADRNAIAREIDTLESDLQSLDAKYSEYAALLIEANKELSEAEALEEAMKEDYDAAEKAREETQKELEAYMHNGAEDYVGSYFAFPVPNFDYWISAYYGWRTLRGEPNFHTGIDIAGAGIYGKPIIASDSGWVARVRYYTTGYGYHVMIDHGNDIWTVYGHMSAIAVSEKQWVNQGDVIGYVGSTGNSTGPHLHFEIRVEGNDVNPLEYMSLP